ncbi:MAG: glycine oxidase ThiO [Candidatus Omnitrophica bacterium]|nr:glycine oxidase ThiO [Candidatus Omnitrophota bacterium]
MRVLIVGGGIIGLSIGEELTRRGVEVQILERNPEAGTEASSAAAGILSPQGEAKGPGPLLDFLQAGYQMIPEAVARLESLTRMDLRLRASGMLALALSDADEEELEQVYSWQTKAGLRLDRVSASHVKQLEPAVDGPVRWGIWWPQTSQIDNVRFVEAYRRAVEAQGGKIETNRPVTRFLTEADRVVGVETPQGKLFGDWVVNCAGSWAGFDLSFSLPIPTIPVKGQILQFRTERPWFQRIVRSARAYFVQRWAQQLIVGTTVEQAGFNKEVTEEGRRTIQAGAKELVSRMASISPEKSWSGLRPGTPDQMPLLGPTPLKQFLLAAGHYRNGILLAPLTGRLIADWITRGTCSMDLSAFSVTRFLAKKTV